MRFLLDYALDWMFWVVAVFLLLCFIRIIRGPSIWDRLLGMNIVATKIVVIIIIYSATSGTAFLLDFAIIYALSGFIGTTYIALFFADRYKRRKNK